MPKISELFLVSDIDGTALQHDQGIPPQNIEAVRRFTAAGGRFTFATGRSLPITHLASDHFAVNAPAIVLNGALVCDLHTNAVLLERPLPPGFHETLREVTQRLEGVAGVCAITPQGYFAVSRSAYSQAICFAHLLANPQVCDIGALGDKIYKVLLAVREPGQVQELRQLAGTLYGRDFTVLQTGDKFVEILAKGVSKGTTLRLLAQRLGIAQENIVAVGDNENDLAMMAFAAFSAAPASARAPIREKADMVLCPCMEGALSMLVEHLERISDR